MKLQQSQEVEIQHSLLLAVVQVAPLALLGLLETVPLDNNNNNSSSNNVVHLLPQPLLPQRNPKLEID